ncbi:MAG: cytidyltransferase [Candidatus Marinimicrobia bacterium]|nr:cytidyltransferase [Candidatus Neomarinimicrobiota bacterium]|tara:strand:+ start:1961 stop:2731 length:771 start_codon:yes stop_codon:yes gene_type:complete
MDLSNSNLKIDAIIQARLSSTRLPKKILKKICGKTILEHVIERVKSAKCVNRIIVATTINNADDYLCEWLQNKNILYFRGDENDVLSRFFEVAKQYACKNMVRITPDDVFKDPVLIDEVAKMYFNENLDFAYNNHPPSYPEGLDVEIFSARALFKAQKESADEFEREHMTQYFYRNKKVFKQKNLAHEKNLSSLRWTVDTEEDFKMAETVYNKLYRKDKLFPWKTILSYIQKNSNIPNMNRHIKRSHHYRGGDPNV